MTSTEDVEAGPSKASINDSDSQVSVIKDEEYFLDGSFVTFQVEDRLFRVPTYQFIQESPDFADIYNLKPVGQGIGDPITLEQIDPDDFRNLLKALYPLSTTLKLTLTKEEWISVLILSTEWRFLRLREVAKTHLESLPDLTSLDRIMLGRKVRIAPWVIQGFANMVRREETISDDEAIDIDCDVVTTCYKLFRLRELRITGRLTSSTSGVENTFREELDRIRSDEKTFDNEQIAKMHEDKLREEEERREKEAEEKRHKEEQDRQREEERRRREEEEMFARDEIERLRAEEEAEAERRAILAGSLKKKKRKK